MPGIFRRPPKPTPHRSLTPPRAPWLDYIAEVRKDAAAFVFPMDEASGNITDLIGGLTGTASGTPTYGVTGPVNGHTAITTTAGCFSIADAAALDIGDGPFSLELWLKRSSASAAGYILGKTDASLATPGYAMEMREGTPDTVRLQNGATSSHINNTADVVGDSNWHHVVFTRALATAAKMYVDGVLVAVSTSALTFSDNNLALVLGALYAGNSYFDGSLAYVAGYKSVLSHDRIQAHVNAAPVAPIADYETEVLAAGPSFFVMMDEASGDLTDLVGALTGTATGSPTYGVTGPIVGHTAIQYTGHDIYHSFANDAAFSLSGHDITIMAFYYRDTDFNDWQGVISKDSAWGMSVDPSDYLDFVIPRLSQQSYHGGGYGTGAWKHIVVQRRAAFKHLSEVIAYVNGAQVTTHWIASIYMGALTDNTNAVIIGKDITEGAGAGGSLGRIAGVAVFKSWLSPEQIARIYAARDVAVSSSDQTVTLGLVDGGATVYGLGVYPIQTVTLGLVDGGATPYSLTLTPITQVTLGLVDGSRAVYDLTLSHVLTRTLGLVDGGATVYSLTLSHVLTRTLGLVDGGATVYGLTLTPVYPLTLALVDGGATVYSLTLYPDQLVTLALVDGGATVYGVTVTDAGGTPQDVTLGLVDGGRTVYDLTVTPITALTLGMVDGGATVYNLTLSHVLTRTLGLVDAGNAVYAITLSHVRTTTLGLVDGGATVYPLTLSHVYPLTLGLVDGGATAYGLTLSHVYTITLPLVDGGATTYSLTIVPLGTPQNVTLDLVDGGAAVYALGVYPNQLVTLALVDGTRAVHDLTLDHVYPLVLDLVDGSATAYAITLTQVAGDTNVTLSLVDGGNVVYSITVTNALAAISGYTRTCTGAILPFTTVDVFRSSDNAWVGTTVSDALGHYSVLVTPGVEHYLVAFSATNVYGVTARDLVGA